MNAATILKTPAETIKDIQGVDRAVLAQTLITSPDDCIRIIDYLNIQMMVAGVDKESTQKHLAIMRNVIEKKIELTAHVLGIDGNKLAFISPNQVQIQFEFEKQPKTEQTTEYKIAPAAEETKVAKVIQMQPKVTTPTAFFEGYVRKQIFGTDYILPENIQTLVVNADTESKIDEIAFELISLGKTEDALNLSIDLFAKLVAPKTMEEVEKRFLFEILPYYYKKSDIVPKDNMQNITLAMWESQLKPVVKENTKKHHNNEPKSKVAKGVENLDKGLIGTFEDDKQITVLTPSSTSHHVKETKIEDAVVIEEVITMTDLEKKVSEKLENGEAQAKVLKFFWMARNKIIDATPSAADMKTSWAKLMDSFKTNLQKKAEALVEDTTIITPEEIQTVTEVAQELSKVSEPITTARTADEVMVEVELKAKEIILNSLSDKNINAQIEVTKLFKQSEIRKMFKGDHNKRFSEWKKQVIAEHPEIVESKKTSKKLIKKFSVEEHHPDVWESAKLCTTSAEFTELIKTIVFDKTTQLPNGWMVAANLTDQYINNFNDTKELTEDQKTEWFTNLVTTVAEERKTKAVTIAEVVAPNTENVIEPVIETITEPIVTEVVTPEAVVETPKVENATTEVIEEKKSIDLSKYDQIKTLNNKGRLNEICSRFLMESTYKTLAERKADLIIMLKSNDRYRKAKDEEINNYIGKIVTSNGAIARLA